VLSGAPAVAGSYTLELATPGCKEQVCQTGFIVTRHEPNVGPGPALTPPSTSSHDRGAIVVHVGSERSRDEALATFAGLRNLAPAALASAEAIIEKVDLGAQGMWHRLRIGPPMSEAKAQALCDALKIAGHAYCSTQVADMRAPDGRATWLPPRKHRRPIRRQ
jgi:cell division septation protein DedD